MKTSLKFILLKTEMVKAEVDELSRVEEILKEHIMNNFNLTVRTRTITKIKHGFRFYMNSSTVKICAFLNIFTKECEIMKRSSGNTNLSTKFIFFYLKFKLF